MERGKAAIVRDAATFAAATNVSRETMGRLNLYESVLRLWQKRINLVAPATLDEVWGRHFYDSAQLLPLIPAEARVFVDLGSGGGFPGLVLAILLHERAACVPLAANIAANIAAPLAAPQSGSAAPPRPWRFVLVESDQRKGAFLREVARQTGVAVEILSTRIEKAETHAKVGIADVVSARALAPLDRLLDLAAPLFGPNTVGLFMKGRGAEAEVAAAREKWMFDVALVPSVTAAEASIVVVRNLRRR